VTLWGAPAEAEPPKVSTTPPAIKPAFAPAAKPPPAIPVFIPPKPASSAPDVEDDEVEDRPIDPALLLIILMGVTIIGLRPLAPEVRYTIAWVAMVVIAILAILYDNLEIEIPTAGDMAIGIGFAAILGLPTFAIFLSGFRQTSLKMFPFGPDAFVFQAAVLIMPAADSLLFRGAIQATRGFLFTVIVSTLWSAILFFPQLQVVEFPLIAAVITAYFLGMSLVYSYLKLRFGVFASWTCQIMLNLLLLFATRLLG
jgi:hypothetical protein